MSNEYYVYFKNYNSPNWYAPYVTKSFIKMLFKVFCLKRKFELIDIHIRGGIYK